MKDKLLHYLGPWTKTITFVLIVFLMMLPMVALLQTPPISSFIANQKEVFRAFIEESLFAVVVLVGVAAVLKVYRYQWHDIFYRVRFFETGFIKGTLLGFLIMLSLAGILLVLGLVEFQYTQLPYQNMMLLALLFLSVAIFEEFLFRSFVLTVFLEKYPLILALMINGLLFALAHLGNPGLAVIGFVNIMLAGALFSIFALYKWNIGWSIGLHFGWNTMQGAILGYHVSGLNHHGTFIAKPKGENYLSGGVFGIEGSIICTIVLLAIIIFLFYKTRLHPFAILEEEREVIEEIKA